MKLSKDSDVAFMKRSMEKVKAWVE